jgi:hypothetical protein
LSVPSVIDLGAVVRGGVDDDGGVAELEDGGFEGNKAAKESIMAGAESRTVRADAWADAGADTALAGVTLWSEGIGSMAEDWASARARACFADD